MLLINKRQSMARKIEEGGGKEQKMKRGESVGKYQEFV